MESNNLSPKRYQLPTSGKIIGCLAALLDEKPLDLKTKQARRYYDGVVVSPKQRRKIFNALADALIDNGILPQIAFKELPLPASEIIASGITFYTEQWDQIGGYTYCHSGRVFQEKHAVMAYLRLAVIDLAVRGIALLWLMDTSEPGDITPIWAQHLGVAHRMRELLEEMGLTREKFAELVEVSDQTLDSWLDDGIRPSIDNIKRIANEVSSRLPQRTTQEWKEYFERNYFLSSVCDTLTRTIERSDVEMLARALCVLITRILPDFKYVKPFSREQGLVIQLETLLLGCQSSRAKHLLDLMWKQEGSKEWKIDIQAAKVNWIQRLQNKIAALGVPETDGDTKLSKVARVALQMLTDIGAESFEPLARGEPEVALKARYKALDILRAGLELAPDDAWLHYHLSGILDDLGDVKGAVEECWIAASLEPSWECPLNDIGTYYMNAGMVNEARCHFEDIVKRQSNPSWDRLMKLGIARMRSGDPTGGLEALEKALDIEPNHPFLLGAATRCAFLLGQQKKAIRYKKRAQLSGAWADPLDKNSWS
jgi:transcriptional regulator with XRE-family HTH domain/Flp pilus assembly protein TadD